ncbi:hypothetical protein ACIQWZ_39810 [Streptomyces sp. NPDC098077]|uniref:hypothetical protein n=1 Tax=Streptomyces sp. NPDC098077 TaxID=3366093 RepID=UPI0037F843D8
MDPTLTAGVLAVAGTLLGALVTGWAQQRTARTSAAAAAAQTMAVKRLAAVADLAAAAAVHRRALWQRQTARATGRDDTGPGAECRTARAQVTRPLTALRILVPDPHVQTAADMSRRRSGSGTHTARRRRTPRGSGPLRRTRSS